MKTYAGIQKVTFDERGRLALPAVLKNEGAIPFGVKEGEALIVSVQPEGCITLYQEMDWEVELARMMERYKNDALMLRAWRRIESFAEKQRVDSMGRLLLSEPILSFARISVPTKKGAYCSLEGNHAKVWGGEAWEEETQWLRSMNERERINPATHE